VTGATLQSPDAATLPPRLAAMPPPAPPAGPLVRYHPSHGLALGAAAASVATVGLVRPPGPGNSGIADVFIALAVAAFVVWAGGARLSLRVPYAIPIALLVSGGAFGAFAGDHQVLGLLTLAQDVVLFAWCVALANTARTAEHFERIVTVWVLAATTYAGLMVLASLTGRAVFLGVTLSQDGGRATLTFGDPNMAGSYLVMSLLLAVAVRHPRSAVARSGVLLLLAVGVILTGSNGAFLALGIGLAVCGLDALTRRRGVLVSIAFVSAVACAVVALLAVAGTGRLSLDDVASDDALGLSVGRSDESLAWRRRATQYAFELYYDGGPLGAGPASSVERLRSRPDAEAIELHHDYLAALVERGIIGAVGILLLTLSLGMKAWSVTNDVLRPDFRDVVARPAALFGALIGVLCSGVVYEILHFRHVWALFAVLAALWLWGRE